LKLQYLGDSKDCFKWDYHDFLVAELGVPQLTLALMMTPDDGGTDGQTDPASFPGRPAVVMFCRHLRESRRIEDISDLPKATGANYSLMLHRGSTCLTDLNRSGYFSGFDSTRRQLVFLDPDNGFEPEQSCREKHVAYRDIAQILCQLPDDSLISVFQHFRRKSFPDDFARIRERLGDCHSTAIYWHSLMFVTIATSECVLEKAIAANLKYAQLRGVTAII
jgi:hypothetical protein